MKYVFRDDDWGASSKLLNSMLVTVPIASIPVGSILSSPIFGEDRRLLLSEGVPVRRELLDLLALRGIERVCIKGDEAAQVVTTRSEAVPPIAHACRSVNSQPTESAMSQLLDKDLEGCPQVPAAERPFSSNVRQHSATPYHVDEVREFRQQYSQNTQRIESFLAQLNVGGDADIADVRSIVQCSLSQIARDKDLLAGLDVDLESSSYLGQHCLRGSMLATAMGTTLGYDESTLTALAMGCLIHDAGMLRISQDMLRSTRILDDMEFAEITKHPFITFDLLEPLLDRVPATARMVTYQMHERIDGSGYPRRRAGRQIHVLAKVAAVADTYTALISPRPYRARLRPYHAMKSILESVQRGQLDSSAARALLETVSLFPIGSWVALSDGRAAKVIRANGKLYDRPVVEAWDVRAANPKPVIVDLAVQTQITVLRDLDLN